MIVLVLVISILGVFGCKKRPAYKAGKN